MTENLYAPIRQLYHFTDERNLPLIRQHGGLLSLARLEELGVNVPAPGGDVASQATDRARNLHRYVHLCLLNKHPMEYRARQSGRIERTIFLRIDTAVLQNDGVKFVPGLANTNGIPIYDLVEALEQGLVDTEPLYRWISWSLFPSVYTRRVAAEKFEIMVPDHIPLERITNFPNG
jgi:hypothetical protein